MTFIYENFRIKFYTPWVRNPGIALENVKYRIPLYPTVQCFNSLKAVFL